MYNTPEEKGKARPAKRGYISVVLFEKLSSFFIFMF
jgi:hypothetical protein